MTNAIVITETGGPEVLKLQKVDVGDPGPGEIRVLQTHIGVNFIDTYHRSGLYPFDLPFTPGQEAAGLVHAVGDGVTHLKEGDRVAYGAGPMGSYAEARLIPAHRVAKLPDSISGQQAAGMMLRGMTVYYLIRPLFHVKPEHTVLFHAAAGGVGLIACQWLSHIGATVIGTVGSEEKAKLAKAHGCTHTILYKEEDFAERTKEFTDGKGVDVVYDGVGGDIFTQSFQCLKPRGMMATFGNAAGPAADVSPLTLAGHGSLFLTRPRLFDYVATQEELTEASNAVFDVVSSGAVNIEIGQSYPLADAAQAHTDLEAGTTTGSTILTVD